MFMKKGRSGMTGAAFLFRERSRKSGTSAMRDGSQKEYFRETLPRESSFQVFHSREVPSVEP